MYTYETTSEGLGGYTGNESPLLSFSTTATLLQEDFYYGQELRRVAISSLQRETDLHHARLQN